MSQKFKFIVVLLIFAFSQQSDASSIPMFRKQLSEVPKENNSHAPVNPPKAEPIGTVTNERCGLSNSCKDDENMTACLSYAGNGPQVPFLIVQNDGENYLKVNFIFLPVKDAFKGLELSNHQAKKINITTNRGGTKSIVLNAGNGNCTIQMGSSAPGNNFYKHFQSYAIYVTPMHSAYVIFSTGIIICGIWACCKLGKGERHLEGVPYQELEMGQPGSLSTMNVETEGWDQGWDDDWDEEKAVKSPGGNRVGNGRANGRSSRSSDNDGWGNDWDD
ncbi:uncharacterized protein LOC132312480 isoform X2 [Cornus florida]|uniref:uncharacterized protein LOC132312480 isoform X2 n=1 Tax=Cornus florida TaxID=4283 RepID=UPI002898746A|nr:uncharacterized protein LOC132312480 isoform X2 [Cornus florida]